MVNLVGDPGNGRMNRRWRRGQIFERISAGKYRIRAKFGFPFPVVKNSGGKAGKACDI